jgi:hypothetical protein
MTIIFPLWLLFILTLNCKELSISILDNNKKYFKILLINDVYLCKSQCLSAKLKYYYQSVDKKIKK